ncbi:Chitinase [Paenibacillus vortex V453]|uniref:chitinase n=2 Tax=Paenibacillus TaxID=44249 RepID=A0A163IIQ7_9BACL|nr:MULTISPECIES: glycoside hydrolase family 18 protein [Paenibacillus]EFU43664.1 Chitinase [Paenibacillus vortex V453]KZS45982.1 chitinase [Paenibacillus glucanolyticus]MDH6673008.1 chitinase [Paenibacillus sp. LBL]
MQTSSWILAGYAGRKVLSQITAEDAQRLTHLNVAFAHIQEDKITYADTDTVHEIQRLKSINPKLTILLSVGGWGSDGFSEAASTAAGRQSVCESAIALLQEFPFDGIDLDWEYPCYSIAGTTASPNDKGNFTVLLKELREALDHYGQGRNHRYLLTIAAGADQYYIEGTEISDIHPYLDFIQLMTYDMRGGFHTLTGHHANLYTSTGDLFRISADASVRMFTLAGVPREKIVIGAAFYSRRWKDVPDVNNGYLQIAPSSGGYGPTYTQLTADYFNNPQFKRFWDDEAKAPYLFDGSSFITYDDPESLTHKCKYIQDQGLAGIMFWEYSCDTTHSLLDAMYRAFHS